LLLVKNRLQQEGSWMLGITMALAINSPWVQKKCRTSLRYLRRLFVLILRRLFVSDSQIKSIKKPKNFYKLSPEERLRFSKDRLLEQKSVKELMKRLSSL
jgi:hypothetical protein